MYFVDGPNRNEYQEYLLGCEGGQCVRLITLPSSCADCQIIWEPPLEHSGPVQACTGIALPFLYHETVLKTNERTGAVCVLEHGVHHS